MEETNRLFQSRVQSELEASSHQLAPGHLHAATLVHLLDKRKGVNSMGELDELARKWNLEGAKKLENVAKYVNSPSVQGNKVIRMVGKGGEEILILSVGFFKHENAKGCALTVFIFSGCLGRTTFPCPPDSKIKVFESIPQVIIQQVWSLTCNSTRIGPNNH